MSAAHQQDPLAQVSGTLLAGCGLPASWRNAQAWTVLDLGFGDGLACLATLRAWHDDPLRPARLHLAALLERPLGRDALDERLARRGVAPEASRPLLMAWPLPMTGVHRLALADGQVVLTLAVGPPARMLPGLVGRVDSVFLDLPADPPAQDGAARHRGPAAALVRHACARLAVGGRASAVTFDPGLARVLADAGMAVEEADRGSGPRVLRATRTRASMPGAARGASSPARAASGTAGATALPPRPDADADVAAAAPDARVALVVGAGLAGAAVAFALARRGWSVLRLDAGGPAGSDQPVLAHHPSLTPDDAPLSRLTRAALLLARGAYDVGTVRWCGRLQLMDPARAHAAAAGLPDGWARTVDAAHAGAIAGVALRAGGLWLPGAGIADPQALRAGWTVDGVRAGAAARVARLLRRGDAWLALDADGREIAQAPFAIVATGAQDLQVSSTADSAAITLSASFGDAGLQWRSGRTTIATAPSGAVPACIVGSADGHAVPIDARRLLLGPVGARGDESVASTGDTPLVSDGAAQQADQHSLVGARHGQRYSERYSGRFGERHSERYGGQHDGPGAEPGADPGPDHLDEAADHPDPVSALAWHRHASRLLSPPPRPTLAAGPSGTRLSTRDHLPLVGAVPDGAAIAALHDTLRRDDRLALPVLPGLHVVTGFGGRGLLWSVLAAELIAARLEAEPSPLERTLADALDPGRFVRRSLRRRPAG